MTSAVRRSLVTSLCYFSLVSHYKRNGGVNAVLNMVFGKEGPEGLKWELRFAFFRDWEMRFCALGMGFMKAGKTIEKWKWDFNLSNTDFDLQPQFII